MTHPSPSPAVRMCYKAVPTACEFHVDDSFVRAIMGPVGSSKSVACVWEIIRKATDQKAVNGLRQSRWSVIRNCFDDKTEVLTETRGWKLFRDLLPDDRVASLDGDQLVFAKPTAYYRFQHAGDMIGFQNEGIDFLVTPNHRMYASKSHTRKKIWSSYNFHMASELFGRLNTRVRRDAHWIGQPVAESVDMFEWLGFWFAEGSSGVFKCADGHTRWQCVVTQAKNLQAVRDLFERAGIAFTESGKPQGGKTFRVKTTEATKPLIEMLSKTGTATTKRVPNWIKNAPPEHLRAFIKGYIDGDGNRGSSTCIFTSSRGMADDLQEMALRAGYVANITGRDRRGHPMCINGVKTTTTAIEWTVTMVTPLKYNPILKAQGYAKKYPGWYRLHYEGEVFCVEVPTHVIYVRRNGRAHWSSQSYPELKSTTIKTWCDWFPEAAFPISWDAPITCRAKFPLTDGTTVELEVLFLALDKPKDVKKLLSLELTGAWINEAREIPRTVLDFLTQRVGRYPAKVAGGPSWSGIILDSNPPDDDHWWYSLFEIEKPDGYRIFKQPGAFIGPSLDRLVQNPLAENVENQPLGYEYWRRMIPGKTWEWVKAYVCGEYARVSEGRLVYPEYVDSRHCAQADLALYRGMPVTLGLDFGLTPCCVFCQFSPKGQVRVIDELCATDLGIRRFTEQALRPKLQAEYAGVQLIPWGDPAGATRSQTDERTCYEILRELGIHAYPAQTNAFQARREAVARYMLRDIDGEPGFLLSPKCKTLRKGFLGGYHFKRVEIANEERYKDEPEKNIYSHPHDGLQYACMGGEPVSVQPVTATARRVVVANPAAWT